MPKSDAFCLQEERVIIKWLQEQNEGEILRNDKKTEIKPKLKRSVLIVGCSVLIKPTAVVSRPKQQSGAVLGDKSFLKTNTCKISSEQQRDEVLTLTFIPRVFSRYLLGISLSNVWRIW